MVADLFQPEEQQWGIAFVVLSSVAGTTVGPIVGGPIEKYLPLQWNFWIQLIFGAVVQAIHFFMPESRSTIVKEPIVLSLSLLSGFSDALIFTFQEGFNPVYKQ